MIKDMTVRAKLAAAFGGLAIIVVLASGLALKSLAEANQRYVDLVNGVHARLTLSYEVRTAIYRAAVGVRNLVLLTTPQDREAERASIAKARDELRQGMTSLTKMAAGPGVADEARRLIGDIEVIEKSYSPVATAVVELTLGGKREEAVEKMNKEVRPLLAALERAGQAYRDYTVVRTERLVEAAASDYARDRTLLIAGCFFAFALAGLTGVLMTRSLTRALGSEPDELGAVAQRVAAGDLSPVAGAASAPQGSVLASLAAMQASLAGIVGQVRGSSDSIATASAQIATGNTDLSQRTEEQASNLQQTAASMEQLASTVKTSAETAAEANRLAASASNAAVKGGEMVGQVVGTMQEISASSHKIADIIGVIDGIAFQTNILALNAAVEAARAGEQGRGFAVVASEVRNLAGRSAEAAKEIKSLIGASVEKVEAGTRKVDEAGASMSEIVTQVHRVSEMIAELSNASAEQSQGIGQIGDAVQQLDQVTQQNAALVEQTAAASESLRLQATELSALMTRFKLDGGGAAGSTAATTAAPARPAAASTFARGVPSKSAAVASRSRQPTPTTRSQLPATEARAAATADAAGEDAWTTF